MKTLMGTMCSFSVRFALVSLFLSWHVGCNQKSDQHDEDYIAIYVQHLGTLSEMPDKVDYGPRLLAGAWADGTVAWSVDQTLGGPPYHAATIERDVVKKAIQTLHHRGLFSTPETSFFGPDSEVYVIDAKHGDSRVTLRSWHVLFESFGLGVAESRGQTGLNGRELYDVISTESPEYTRFRYSWSEAQRVVVSLCLRGGNRSDGGFKIAVAENGERIPQFERTAKTSE